MRTELGGTTPFLYVLAITKWPAYSNQNQTTSMKFEYNFPSHVKAEC